MGVETLLLLVGSAATVAAIGIAAYKGMLSRRASPHAVQSVASTPTAIAQPVPSQAQEISVREQFATAGSIVESTTNTQAENSSVMEASVFEAPPPFPEESQSVILPMHSTSTTIPADIAAVANFANPAENATASVLVISTPKRRARTSRKLTSASTGATKRKRTARSKLVASPTAVASATATATTTTTAFSAGAPEETGIATAPQQQNGIIQPES